MDTSFKCKIVFLIFSLLAAGCGKDIPSFSLLPDGQTFKQSKTKINNQLDILWVVDNSGSMKPYQTNLVNNFSSFINNFQNKGYDFHISVTSTQAYKSHSAFGGNLSWSRFSDGVSSHTGVFVILPTTPNINSVFTTNATLGTAGSGDERAFSSFKETLTNPQNSGFLRSQSFLAIIILSDEDDFSGNGRCAGCSPSRSYTASTLDPVSNFVSYLDNLTSSTGELRRYNVSAIAVIDNACQQQNQATGSIIGQRYMQLADSTKGVKASICSPSFATALNQIQAQIAELSTQFVLDRVPDVSTIVIQVNGVTIPQSATNGWTYNSAANSIMFHGSAIPPQDAVIGVNYVPITIKQ